MSGTFTYEYNLGEETFDLEVEWEQTGSYRRATLNEPAEYPEVSVSIELNGCTFLPNKEVYGAITDRAFEELEHEQEAHAGQCEDAEYERRRQRMLDDE